ncbi:hypothetical protein C8R44DRAFT_376748 [Mycena epipterygia]|nr:hypothetical protein C8R44DRAFT_376748 [Mycena epipterygia]
MILPLTALLWCLVGVAIAVPLSSSSSSSSSSTASSSTASSSPDGIAPTNPHMNTGGNSTIISLPPSLPPTIKQQLNTTLSKLSPGAIDRWVTAEPISSTSLGSDDPTQSNADLASLVDKMFTNDSSIPGRDSWVDTYLNFLIEAGNTNVTQTQENTLFTNYNNATTAFATAQVKLVQAYEDANPNNVTYVGVNIYNASKIDPLSLKVIEHWGSQGNGSYSKDDYADYIELNKTLTNVTAQYNELSETIQVAFQGYQYKLTLNTAPPIFNLSMVVGGQISSTDVEIVPAWAATIINNTDIAPSAVNQLPANLTTNITASASSSVSQRTSSVSRSSATSHAARSTPSQGRGFSSIKSVAKNQTNTDKSPITPSSGWSSSKSVAHSPAPDPLGGISNTLKGNLMVFSVQPGKWASDLASNVEWAMKERPEVVEKYFGKGNSGMGPIGRWWTHVILLTTYNPNTTVLDSAQVLGKVWNVLPILKGLNTTSTR